MLLATACRLQIFNFTCLKFGDIPLVVEYEYVSAKQQVFKNRPFQKFYIKWKRLISGTMQTAKEIHMRSAKLKLVGYVLPLRPATNANNPRQVRTYSGSIAG